MKRLAAEAGTLIRFGAVGILATAVHLTVAGLVLAGWPQLSVFLVNLLAFIVAFQVSYWGHRHVTFRRPGRMTRFLTVALGGFAANNLLLGGLVVSGILEGFWAILVATLLVPLIVYLLARFWAFAH